MANLRQDKALQEERQFAYAFFVIGAVFYAVQVSSAPIWSLFLGIGWAAAKFTTDRVYQTSRVPSSIPETRRDSFVPVN